MSYLSNNTKNIAVRMNGAPQTVLLAVNLYNNCIQMPFTTIPRPVVLHEILSGDQNYGRNVSKPSAGSQIREHSDLSSVCRMRY